MPRVGKPTTKARRRKEIQSRRDAVLAAAEKRLEAEEEKRLALAKGELGLDMYAMREVLAKKGLRYE